MSYSVVVLTVFCIVSVLSLAGRETPFLAVLGTVVVLGSATFFYLVTISVVRLISTDFQINPIRFLRDVCISAIFSIAAFALLFSGLGIRDTAGSTAPDPSGLDYIYFSAVTFSTLGYGDFRPEPLARIPAAIEALFGNLHLGMIAGGIFLMIQVYGKRDVS